MRELALVKLCFPLPGGSSAINILHGAKVRVVEATLAHRSSTPLRVVMLGECFEYLTLLNSVLRKWCSGCGFV